MRATALVTFLSLGSLLVGGLALAAPAPAPAPTTRTIGVDEHLGAQLDLASYTFNDEDGNPVTLDQLVDRPTVLTLVFFRCSGICTPLLNELASVANKCELDPGPDYRILTISFDPEDVPKLAKTKQANMIKLVDHKEVDAADWRFLTGDPDNIERLTDTVGFRYVRDENGIDFVHSAVLIFLSPEGKVVRYLNGVQFNPADLKMALVDAAEGRARSFMQRLERLCYSYDPEGRAYVLKINRIILGGTLLFAALFVLYLVLKKGGRRQPSAAAEAKGSGS